MNMFRSRSKDSQSTSSAPRKVSKLLVYDSRGSERRQSDSGHSMKKSVLPRFERLFKKHSSQPPPYQPDSDARHDSAQYHDASSQEHGRRFSQQAEKIKIGASHGIALTVTSRQEQAEEPKPQKDDPTIMEAAAAEDSIYRRAVLLRSPKEQAILEQNQSMKALFTDLQGPMDEYDETRTNKVIKTIRPWVSVVQDVVKFSAVITSVEPATSTAISIISLFTSTCTVICQASAEAFDHFEKVTKELHWLYRCEGQFTEKPEMSVQEALLNVYTALLDIFFNIHGIFIKTRENVKSEGQANATIYTHRKDVLVRMLWDNLRGELGPMQETFKARCNTLRAALDIDTNQTSHETHEAVKRIEKRLEQSVTVAKADQSFPELRAFLGENSVASKQQDGRRSDLKHREDAACAWIDQNKEFVSWAGDITHKAKVLHLRGSAGSGKSVTTAYVADHALLSSNQDNRPRFICKHFCRDDNQANDGATIFKSLLAQVLAARPELLEFIATKLPDIETSFASDQSQQDAWKIFSDALGRLADSVSTYIVVDGLDECKPESCDQLVAFFQNVCDTTNSVRIFLSSRDHDLSFELGSYMRCIHQQATLERDMLIIRYQLTTTSPKLRFSGALMDYAVNKIAEKTKGIVIWSHMAIEYLRKKKAKNAKMISQCLQVLPAAMTGMYCKHFEAATEEFGDSHRVHLSGCLEIIAGALSPLTLEELTWAVWLKTAKTEDRRAVTVKDFDEDIHKLSGDDLMALLRAFLLLPDVNSGQNGKPLQLIHQSLKETILQLEPAHWAPKAFPDARLSKQREARQQAINQIMLDLCVDYLLRDDIKDTRNDARYLEDAELRVFDWFDFEDPEESSAIPEHRENAAAFHEHDVKLSLSPEAKEQKPESTPAESDAKVSAPDEDDFDTDLAAFQRRNPQLGGFFSYAACHWYLHLQQSDPLNTIQLSDLLALSKSGTIRVENWIERASLEPSTDVRGLPQDILTLSVFYGGFAHFDRIMDAKRNAAARSAKVKLNGEENTDYTVEADVELNALGFKSVADIDKALYDVTERAIKTHDTQVLSELAEKGQLSTYASLFGVLSEIWPRLATVELETKWTEMADLLFKNLAANMSSIMSETKEDDAEHFPCRPAQGMLFEVICRAAELGCLPMVKKVVAFHKERCPIQSSLPARPMRSEALLKSGSGIVIPIEESRDATDFGPLGCAVWGGHTEVVLYLLQVDGIDRHLRYHRELGSNILHFLVARANFVDIKIIKALVDHYPEAINEVNPNTPIQDLVTNYASDNDKVTEVLNYLIESGADLKGGASDVKLLEAAAKYNKVKTCNCLIRGGLDPREVIDISETGEATLKVRIGDQGDPVEEKALAEKILTMPWKVPGQSNTAST